METGDESVTVCVEFISDTKLCKHHSTDCVMYGTKFARNTGNMILTSFLGKSCTSVSIIMRTSAILGGGEIIE